MKIYLSSYHFDAKGVAVRINNASLCSSASILGKNYWMLRQKRKGPLAYAPCVWPR